jgi:alpha/beta superfamily hydrolase
MPTLARDEGLVVEHVRFPSHPYWLEGELVYPAADAPVGSAVVAGPHPLLGGDMRNNVVVGLSEGLAARGVAVLRFNYRGVGGSEGPAVDSAAHLARFWATSHVDDEGDFRFDLAAADDFLRSVTGGASPTALLGYSFGCTLLPHAAGAADPLVLVAPTVGVHAYDAYDGLINPLLVVASEDDFAADAGRLRDWFGRLSARKRLLQPRLDDHFFRGHEEWLAETTFAFLREQWR